MECARGRETTKTDRRSLSVFLQFKAFCFKTYKEVQGRSVNRDMDNRSNCIMVQNVLSTEWAVS